MEQQKVRTTRQTRKREHGPSEPNSDVNTSNHATPQEKKKEEPRPPKRHRCLGSPDEDEEPVTLIRIVNEENVEVTEKKHEASAQRSTDRDSWSLLDALDADSALAVLQVLAQEGHFATLLSLRAVNLRWCILASADNLWRPRFIRVFGPTPYETKDAKEAARADKPIKRQAYYPEVSQEEESTKHLRSKEDEQNPRLEYDDESADEEDNKAHSAENMRKKRAKTWRWASSWFQRYTTACRCLPVAIELPHLTQKFNKFHEDWCSNSEEWLYENMDRSLVCTRGFQFSAVRLMHQSDNKRVPYRMHRLAVILAILHSESHVPSPGDMVRIGYSQKNSFITLARFCYAYIHGKEIELLEELDLLSPPSIGTQENKKNKIKNKNKKQKQKDADDDTEDSDDGSAEKRYGWRQDKDPALGLNVDGEFEPFVYFRAGIYGHRVSLSEPNESRLELLDFMSHNKEAFGTPEEFDPTAYCFRTPRRGWAPGFFNASYTWFKHAAISTVYNRKRKQIIVIKATEKEMVW